MSAAVLLQRLDGVRQTGPSKWIARCPGHDDKSPSLAVSETSDGTVLLHDFAGCSALEVLQSVGLELRDLFPGPVGGCHPASTKYRRPFDALQVLRCIEIEVYAVRCIAADVLNDVPLTVADWERAELAAERLATAVEIAHGR